MTISQSINRLKRARKSRTKITNRDYRIRVFRSLKHSYAQLVQGDGRVIGAASDLNLADRQPKVDQAFKVGQQIAGLAKKNQIFRVIFDRSGYQYHGRIKAIAEGARRDGLIL